MSFVTDIRISKAKELLDRGLSVSEVAAATGFSDAFYFSNCFKKFEVMSPSAYKNRNSYKAK